jgi:hypothetical protein
MFWSSSQAETSDNNTGEFPFEAKRHDWTLIFWLSDSKVFM